MMELQTLRSLPNCFQSEQICFPAENEASFKRSADDFTSDEFLLITVVDVTGIPKASMLRSVSNKTKYLSLILRRST